MAERSYRFIDLFAGCGGLSEGFYKQGYKALLHLEIDQAACKTLSTRMKYSARKHNETDRERYRILSQHKNWQLKDLQTIRPDLIHHDPKHFGNRYTVQEADKPGKTVVAHLYKDGNLFIYPDPEQARTFTVREAARIQSFPDDFVFEGSRTDQFKQVGNAVPPLMAETFAKTLKKYLDIIHIKRKNNALSEENPHVCIGWSAMGDLSGLETTEDITERYEQHFDKNNYAKGQEVGIIRRFLKEAQVGDYVIFAEPSEFHIGKIESDYYYDDTDNPWQDSDYKNSRKVMWLKKHIDRSILSTALHHSLSTAMSFFGINDYRAAVVDLLRGTYKKDEETSTIESTDLIFQTSVNIPYERNRIVFGAPGTGKSHRLEKDSKKIEAEFGGTFERVTFHPDYTYSQFVGTYKPVMDDAGEKIKYEYVPGPFTRVLIDALKGALKKDNKPYLLIIEEINRAKVAAVFGEVFQWIVS